METNCPIHGFALTARVTGKPRFKGYDAEGNKIHESPFAMVCGVCRSEKEKARYARSKSLEAVHADIKFARLLELLLLMRKPLSILDAAKKLQLSSRTIRRYFDVYKFAGFHVISNKGRFHISNFEILLSDRLDK